MKQQKIKHGGSRAGAGRPYKYQSGKTKLVRIPVAYVDKILRVVAYMDANEGQLPQGIAFATEKEDFSFSGIVGSKQTAQTHQLDKCLNYHLSVAMPNFLAGSSTFTGF